MIRDCIPERLFKLECVSTDRYIADRYEALEIIKQSQFTKMLHKSEWHAHLKP